MEKERREGGTGRVGKGRGGGKGSYKEKVKEKEGYR